MKKGISLIVLVITIIVMIIIAGAIIMSLSTTDIMTKANDAVTASNRAEAKSIGASVLASNLYVASPAQSNTYVQNTTGAINQALEDALDGTGFTATYDGTTVTYEDAAGATF